jgi:hypothetical protein
MPGIEKCTTMNWRDYSSRSKERRYDTGEVSDEEFDGQSRVMIRVNVTVVMTLSGAQFLLPLAFHE